MRGQTTWNYQPYSRLCDIRKREKPYICRMAPYETSCEIEWFDHGSDGEHSLICHQRGAHKPDIRMDAIPRVVTIEGLLPGREYEVIIFRTDDPDQRSDYRFFRAGNIIGTVVNYLHPHDPAFNFSGSYLCSPCIVRTQTGRLLVSMDVYGPSTPQNLSFVYKSDDDGKPGSICAICFPVSGESFSCMEIACTCFPPQPSTESFKSDIQRMMVKHGISL